MSTIAQNGELLKNLFQLLADQHEIAGQKRVCERIELLVLAELFTFGRHTITQLLMSLGLNPIEGHIPLSLLCVVYGKIRSAG